jgi:hypothetical protein
VKRQPELLPLVVLTVSNHLRAATKFRQPTHVQVAVPPELPAGLVWKEAV